jgi:hypothetical protein
MTREEIKEIVREVLLMEGRLPPTVYIEELITTEENPRRFAKTELIDGTVAGIAMQPITNEDLPDLRVVYLSGDYIIAHELQ